MTKREIIRRIKQLIAREMRSGAFTEVPDHIMDEPEEVIAAWPDICQQVADKLDNGVRA